VLPLLHKDMKLTIAELRLIVQLKQDIEQGRVAQALSSVFGMKDVLDKLVLIKQQQS